MPDHIIIMWGITQYKDSCINYIYKKFNRFTEIFFIYIWETKYSKLEF